MKKMLLVSALVAACVATPASAKEPIGSARVLFTPIPKGIRAGQPWDVRFRFYFQDGEPWRISGLAPTVTIRNTTTGKTRVFAVIQRDSIYYAARVKFPTAGTWIVTFRFDTTQAMGTRRLISVAVR